MIKANELRIGNYVKQKLHNDVRRIVELELERISHTHIGIPDSEFGLWDDEEIDGIPLTPEWLDKFGFKYYPERSKFEKRISKRRVIAIVKNKFSYSVDRYIHISNIEFVHQLQNLFFALTNEELTPKDYLLEPKKEEKQ